ncbi:MAG: hypothetical protein COA66_09150 [Arcobacter sp.]|nr:MAG: hypothetical protein COA66_09150 [Arcobacter sp.]
MKKRKFLLLINTDFKLTDEQIKILDFISTHKNITAVKNIFRRNLSTNKFRKKFENKINDFDNIFIFDIFHITIDIKYLLSLENKEIIFIKNSYFDIDIYFENSHVSSIGKFKYYYLYDILMNQSSHLNIFLKKSIQKIGRDKKKNEHKLKNKVWKFGRPINKKGTSQFDRDREIIRYRLNQGKSIKEIRKILGYGSISALKHFVKSRYKKNYI